jgi:hypothetical protein
MGKKKGKKDALGVSICRCIAGAGRRLYRREGGCLLDQYLCRSLGKQINQGLLKT